MAALRTSPSPSALPLPVKLLSGGVSTSPPPPTTTVSTREEQERSLLVTLTADDVATFVRQTEQPLASAPPAPLLPEGRAARGWTWLHAASAAGAAGILQYLLAPGKLFAGVGSLVDRRAGDGSTALMLAAEHRHTDGADCDCVAALLRAGANASLQRKSDGASVGHLCAAARCAGCLRVILQRAPQLVDVRSHAGERPLHTAARTGASGCAAELCSLGARVDAPTEDKHGRTALHLACAAGSRRTAALLIERRAQLHVRDRRGRAPLWHATAALKPRAVSVLIAAGAEPQFAGACATALRQCTDAATDAILEQAALQTHTGPIGPRAGSKMAVLSRLFARWSGVMACLVSAGATVSSSDLTALGLGWAMEPGNAAPGAMPEAAPEAAQDGRPSLSPPSLFVLSQRAVANHLSADTVLPTLDLARMLDAGPLRSECERLVCQQSTALEEAGAFAAAGVPAMGVVRAIIDNALRRRAAEIVVARGKAGASIEEGRARLPRSALPVWAATETDPLRFHLPSGVAGGQAARVDVDSASDSGASTSDADG